MSTITGTTKDDILYGTSSADKITGKSGNDILYGGAGNDTIYGDAGKDQLYGEAGNDYLYGGSGNDMLIGGKYTYSSEFENDYLDGGEGADRMYGGNGNDTYVVDNVGDGVYEQAGYGTDLVISKLQEYTLAANVENGQINSSVTHGILHGNELDNVLTGNNLSNTLYGEAGNDKLVGGNISDFLYGGAGNDTYIIRTNGGVDSITDTSGNDTIAFQTGISKENIAIFLDSDDTLYIDYGAEYADDDRVKVLNQSTNTIENIVTADGSTLTNTQINQLIQDMSAYATENGITISSVEDVKANADLMNLVNSAWTTAA